MDPETFTTVLGSTDTGGIFIEVPADVAARLGQGRRRPAVIVTVGGVTYPSTIAVYGGRSYLGVRREIRERAGVAAGERVEVTLALDVATREVELPDDLGAAFDRDPRLAAGFAAASYTTRRERVEWLTSAKRPDTRARRLATLLEGLREEAVRSKGRGPGDPVG